MLLAKHCYTSFCLTRVLQPLRTFPPVRDLFMTFADASLTRHNTPVFLLSNSTSRALTRLRALLSTILLRWECGTVLIRRDSDFPQVDAHVTPD